MSVHPTNADAQALLERRRESSSSSSSSDGTDSDDEGPRTWNWWGMLVLDLLASSLFWYVLTLYIPDWVAWSFLGVLFVSMVAYRLYRARTTVCDNEIEIPYTCGYVQNNDKEMFLVATIHISPRAPKDVEAVIERTVPDITMIELDNERLDRMRDVEEGAPQKPKLQDLQPIKITTANGSSTLHAQRALWNAERSGETVEGDIIFDESNAYGLERAEASWEGRIALVNRGSSKEGEFAPFALKAFNAARAGAEAVLVIDKSNNLPPNRIGGATLVGDMRVAMKACSCGFPSIPLMLLTREEGERLRQLCKSDATTRLVRAELEVLPDDYPRRTLRLRLCQASALLFSGIGILYGIIQCFNVEVGAEFLAAEIAARRRGIRCACIDVDMNEFWHRLASAVVPTPCNIMRSLLAWLAFPRVCWQFLFPPHGNVDVLGSMLLHAISFPCCTWVAFILAGFCASFVTNKVLALFGFGVEQAGESTGVVAKEDREMVQEWIMIAIELYLLPQIYDAVAASRDEAMYKSIVEKSQSHQSSRCVVVVGAGHANGILQRARGRGL